MKTVTIKISFDAAKRLMNYKGKCNQLHGYRHVIEATFTNKKTGDDIIVDFHELEKTLGNWVERYWDHNTILNKKDKKLGAAINKITNQKVYYTDFDPTAENLAQFIKNKICPKLFSNNVKCVSVRFYDNPNAFVEVK